VDDLEVTGSLIVPGSELEWTAVRASGPGGQNVNKVATKVVLRFDPRSPSLSAKVSERLQRLAAGRLDAEGRIAIHCDTSRSQSKNLSLARERLIELIQAALVVPKKRRPTKPSKAAKRARLEGKRQTGEKKRQRRSGGTWD
jgi:ribosome-associated protein